MKNPTDVEELLSSLTGDNYHHKLSAFSYIQANPVDDPRIRMALQTIANTSDDRYTRDRAEKTLEAITLPRDSELEASTPPQEAELSENDRQPLEDIGAPPPSKPPNPMVQVLNVAAEFDPAWKALSIVKDPVGLFLLGISIVLDLALARKVRAQHVAGGRLSTPTIQTSPANTENSFLEKQSHATVVGATVGLVSVITTLLGVGFALEVIIDFYSQASDASGVAFVAMFLVCSPYPLIAVAAGAFMGRLSVKRGGSPDEEVTLSRRGLVRSGIAGLIIGSLPYSILMLIGLIEYMHTL